MTQYDDRAAHLQQMTRESERQKAESYEQADANRAAVYTREDLVLIASHISSVNEQLAWVRRLLAAVVVLLIVGLILR